MPSWEVEPDRAAIERYFARMPLPTRVVALELDALVRAALPRATMGIKWGVPFYARKGPVCYISAAQRHVTFGLLQGAEIPDASGRLTSTGKSPIAKAVFKAGDPVPTAEVRAWLKRAVALDRTWGAP